ncbi:hypothetical protein JCM19239_570 [Vibrio variabilis]|uniref:Uncharacterized protein n=1 Tax=Vibrio variabilis TaxID=990271 RepID=A0ABQ0JA28_9VIBR|nr:hypothetical protein JCM19239_570 [Vibrio variabilis]
MLLTGFLSHSTMACFVETALNAVALRASSSSMGCPPLGFNLNAIG